MYGGLSGCTGIILYDSKIEGKNTVFGYYEKGKIVIEEGEYEAIKQFKKNKEKCFKRKRGAEIKVMIGLFLVTIAAIIFSLKSFPFLQGAFLSILWIMAYFPLMVVLFANVNSYKTKELHEQFTRYHGCEHAALKLLAKDKEITLDNLKAMKIYDEECGTAYMGYLLFLIVTAAILCLNITVLGFFKCIIIFVVAIIALIINIFNPYNPFVLLQKNVVSSPTDKEYYLGLELIKRLKEL